MDGRGRVAQSLTGAESEAIRVEPRRAPVVSTSRALVPVRARVRPASGLDRWIERQTFLIKYCRLTRGGGVVLSLLIVLGAVAYGVVKGDHVDTVVAAWQDTRDALANVVGLRITEVALSGNKHLNREEVLARAGVTGNTALVFFDVGTARTRLLADPWIADATIQKLYPDRLQITLTEREAFALWQANGRVNVIGTDGTVLEPFVSRPYMSLPFVVGRGADKRAKAFLEVLDRYPEVRDNVLAAVLIAERRWNLRLRNGIDVRLPESGVDQALAALITLDHDKKLMSRDLVAIDLRLPDRITVRLSDAAAQARDAELKERAKAHHGGAV